MKDFFKKRKENKKKKEIKKEESTYVCSECGKDIIPSEITYFRMFNITFGRFAFLMDNQRNFYDLYFN